MFKYIQSGLQLFISHDERCQETDNLSMGTSIFNQ